MNANADDRPQQGQPDAPAGLRRILIVNYEYPPVGGGAAVASRSLARALQSQGHAVTILTARASDEPPHRVESGIGIHRVPCIRRGIHDMGLFGAWTFLAGAAFRLRGMLRRDQFDCAIFYFALPTGLLAPIWHLLTRQPYIVALRGSDVPGYSPGPTLATLHALLRPLTQAILRRAVAVVANSDGLRELARRGFPGQAVRVIRNGVDDGDFNPGEVLAGVRPRLRAVCVARLIHRKGIDLLIEALADPRCGDIELDVVGSGPRLARLRATCRRLGLHDRVRFLGLVANDALPAVYRSADVFVLPSRSESCSMALLEAMACGLPVVATGVGGTPELVQDGRSGYLVPTDDAAAIAARLATLRDSPELRQRMGGVGRAIVREHHSWRRVADAYLGLLARPGG